MTRIADDSDDGFLGLGWWIIWINRMAEESDGGELGWRMTRMADDSDGR